MVDSGETPSVVYELRNKVEDFREKLEVSIHSYFVMMSIDCQVTDGYGSLLQSHL